MVLINQSDPHANWWDVLALWERIANWIYYGTSETRLQQQIRMMLVNLWNEKDWLREHYPAKAEKIERAINASKYMCMVGDLANTVKHRNLTKKRRSASTQTDYYGKIKVTGGAERRLYYINVGNGKHEEIMTVLRGALDEFEKLRVDLSSGSL